MPTDGTGNAKVERRLAAILAADIAGYSALMGADEEAHRPRSQGAPSRRAADDRRNTAAASSTRPATASSPSSAAS